MPARQLVGVVYSMLSDNYESLEKLDEDLGLFDAPAFEQANEDKLATLREIGALA